MFAYTVWKIPVITYYYISKEISCTIEEFVFRTVKTQVIIKVRNLIDDKKECDGQISKQSFFAMQNYKLHFTRIKKSPLSYAEIYLSGLFVKVTSKYCPMVTDKVSIFLP